MSPLHEELDFPSLSLGSCFLLLLDLAPEELDFAELLDRTAEELDEPLKLLELDFAEELDMLLELALLKFAVILVSLTRTI